VGSTGGEGPFWTTNTSWPVRNREVILCMHGNIMKKPLMCNLIYVNKNLTYNAKKEKALIIHLMQKKTRERDSDPLADFSPVLGMPGMLCHTWTL
jgi:hypothetical protein